ncbi:hypothetical protein CK936_01320 [Streptomyces albireticuli]|uniref:Transposase IS701-like DDE domain-containing protein n=1 Tax=Streptomyces albireticuli TaxID=1940 RepID=A0A2A2DH84_9ACTN|nr:hypothetical protein CK936_01320 [Streptomyces albireticuli]
MSVVCCDVRREAFAEASRFRGEFYECLTARRDELFELTDALLCVDGPVTSPVELTLVPEHPRGHGALYGALNRGRIDVDKLRTLLAGLPLPRFDGGRLVLAVDVSPWLRSDAPCSADRLFCHVYGRAKSASQFIPGWPYSFVAVLEPRGHVMDRDYGRGAARARGRCDRGHRRPAEGHGRAAHRGRPVDARRPGHHDRHGRGLRRHPPGLGPAGSSRRTGRPDPQ